MAKKSNSPMDKGETPEPKRKDGDDDPKLIETDNDQDKPLIACARKIRALDRERGEIQDKADAKREDLKQMMHDRKLTTYRFGDVYVELKSNEKVSVKLAERNDGGSDGGDDD